MTKFYRRMYFSHEIGNPTVMLLSLGALCAVFTVSLHLVQLRKVIRHKSSCDMRGEDLQPEDLPQASVIIYAQNQAEELESLLPQILKQDYPAGFEVIVVNEGSSDTTSEIVGRMQLSHKNLYLTFTPDGARNLSRKKLALTLGIKAARNGIAVMTDASVSIASDQWLKKMMRNFTPETEVVLGYAAPDKNGDTQWGRRRRAFDFTAAGITWLSAAIAGRPYRGTGYNIAYRRDLFFRNKGFSRSLNMHYGDDDIFIDEIATGSNTAVELSSDSIVECRFSDHAKALRELQLRRRFTQRFVNRGALRLMAFSAWMIWPILALTVSAVATDWRNLFVWTVAAALSLGMLIPTVILWHKTMTVLNSRGLLLTLPWMIATRPLRNIALSIRSRMSKRKNYTWD